MAIIRRDGWLWDFVSRLFGLHGFEGGEIILSYGDQQVTINTDAQPRRVWLSIEEPEHSIPVCCGDVNFIGATIVDHGFVLCSDIKSDLVLIQWYIEF